MISIAIGKENIRTQRGGVASFNRSMNVLKSVEKCSKTATVPAKLLSLHSFCSTGWSKETQAYAQYAQLTLS